MTGRDDAYEVPREYQLEIFERARHGNIVAFLPTGSGKTCISFMLMRDALHSARDPRQVVLFTAPTKFLVRQQALYARRQCPVPVLALTGESYASSLGLNDNHEGLHIDRWSPQEWDKVLRQHGAVFMTPQVALNALDSNFIRGEDVLLLIVDEAHHCMGNDPSARLCEAARRKGVKRIFGMTASPGMKAARSAAQGHKTLLQLQAVMGCTLTTVYRATDSLHAHSHMATPGIVNYDGGAILSWTNELEGLAGPLVKAMGCVPVGQGAASPSLKLTVVRRHLAALSFGLCRWAGALHAVARYTAACREGLESFLERAIDTHATLDAADVTGLEAAPPEHLGLPSAESLEPPTAPVALFEEALRQVHEVLKQAGPLPALLAMHEVMEGTADRSMLDDLISDRDGIGMTEANALLSSNFAGLKGSGVILDLSRVVGSHCALLKTFPIPLRHLAVPSHRLVRTSLVLMALAILAHFPPDFLTHLTALSGSDTTPALARLAATLQRGAVNPRDIWNLARTVDRPIPGEGKPGPEPNAADGERTEVRSINRARMALSAALARVIEVAREQGMFDRAAVAREDALKELVTSKVASLIAELLAYKPRIEGSELGVNSWAGITFVSLRLLAVSLARLLSLCPSLDFLPTGRLFSLPQNKVTTMTAVEQEQVLRDFWSGRLKHLVATSVAEEGLDIRACAVVINFCPPQQPKSYLQRRGRARARDSEMLLMVPAGPAGAELRELLQGYQTSEEDMMEVARELLGAGAGLLELQDPLEGLDSETSEGDEERGVDGRELVFVSRTGCLVDALDAGMRLRMYCESLPRDSHHSPRPVVAIEMIDKDTGEAVTDPAAVRQSDKDVPSWRVSCLMPPGTHPLARCVKGPVVTRSKRKAKAAIVLQIIETLYNAGELNESLLPVATGGLSLKSLSPQALIPSYRAPKPVVVATKDGKPIIGTVVSRAGPECVVLRPIGPEENACAPQLQIPGVPAPVDGSQCVADGTGAADGACVAKGSLPAVDGVAAELPREVHLYRLAPVQADDPFAKGAPGSARLTEALRLQLGIDRRTVLSTGLLLPVRLPPEDLEALGLDVPLLHVNREAVRVEYVTSGPLAPGDPRLAACMGMHAALLTPLGAPGQERDGARNREYAERVATLAFGDRQDWGRVGGEPLSAERTAALSRLFHAGRKWYCLCPLRPKAWAVGSDGTQARAAGSPAPALTLDTAADWPRAAELAAGALRLRAHALSHRDGAEVVTAPLRCGRLRGSPTAPQALVGRVAYVSFMPAKIAVVLGLSQHTLASHVTWKVKAKAEAGEDRKKGRGKAGEAKAVLGGEGGAEGAAGKAGGGEAGAGKAGAGKAGAGEAGGGDAGVASVAEAMEGAEKDGSSGDDPSGKKASHKRGRRRRKGGSEGESDSESDRERGATGGPEPEGGEGGEAADEPPPTFLDNFRSKFEDGAGELDELTAEEAARVPLVLVRECGRSLLQPPANQQRSRGGGGVHGMGMETPAALMDDLCSGDVPSFPRTLPSALFNTEGLLLACEARRALADLLVRGGAARDAASVLRPGGVVPSPALMREALTLSHANTHVSQERLEFLGDALLKLVISCMLYCTLPNKSEAILSAAKSGIVSNDALAGRCRDLGLEDFMWVKPLKHDNSYAWRGPGMGPGPAKADAFAGGTADAAGGTASVDVGPSTSAGEGKTSAAGAGGGGGGGGDAGSGGGGGGAKACTEETSAAEPSSARRKLRPQASDAAPVAVDVEMGGEGGEGGEGGVEPAGASEGPRCGEKRGADHITPAPCGPAEGNPPCAASDGQPEAEGAAKRARVGAEKAPEPGPPEVGSGELEELFYPTETGVARLHTQVRLKSLADTFEAVLGAFYTQGGLLAAFAFLVAADVLASPLVRGEATLRGETPAAAVGGAVGGQVDGEVIGAGNEAGGQLRHLLWSLERASQQGPAGADQVRADGSSGAGAEGERENGATPVGREGETATLVALVRGWEAQGEAGAETRRDAPPAGASEGQRGGEGGEGGGVGESGEGGGGEDGSEGIEGGEGGLVFPPGFPEVLKHQAEFDAMAASAVRDKVAADLVEWVCERFGYRFQDPSLALRAFTHCSHPMLASNQRLEFLGDAALDWVVTLKLLDDMPDAREGVLTEGRMAWVNNNHLAYRAVVAGLHRHLIHASPPLVAAIGDCIVQVEDLRAQLREKRNGAGGTGSGSAEDAVASVGNDGAGASGASGAGGDERGGEKEVSQGAKEGSGGDVGAGGAGAGKGGGGTCKGSARAVKGGAGAGRGGEAGEGVPFEVPPSVPGAPKALADVVEALLGAVLLDSGWHMEAVRRVWERLVAIEK